MVHDCGRVLNPLIVDGQVHGGVAQGIGNAFYEQLVFDEDGQLLNASFMDFLLPTALDVPRIDRRPPRDALAAQPARHQGRGEAGAIPVGALFAQAVENALESITGGPRDGLEITEIPLSPSRLWQRVQTHLSKRGAA